jgi:hypothetical protein
MPYTIAIPSYNRPIILLYKTLNFLERNSIDPKLIYIFIVEEDLDDYSQIPTYLYNKMVIGVKGIVKQREFIDNYFKEGDHIVSIDDDIQDLIFANPHEEIPLDEFLNNAFELCKKESAFIWGLYPVGNAFYAQKNKWYSTHLTYIIGAFYGYINRPTNEEIKCPLTYNGQNGEDYERSIRYWLHDKKVIRFNTVCIKTTYFGKDGGGIGLLQDRLESMKFHCKLLHANYPSYTRLKIKKNGLYQLVLKDGSGQTLKIKDK